MYKERIKKCFNIYKKSFINNKQGMITIESLIVFPLTILIVFVFTSFLFLEFEKSHIILSSNQMSIDSLLYKNVEIKNNEFLEVKKTEDVFKENVKVNYQIRFTSDIMPEWTKIDLLYKNKSTNFKKFNVLILKEALFDTFVSESEGVGD